MGKQINKKFFNYTPEIVAKKLLGKILVRKTNKKLLKAKIVETEAYYGKADHASWARFNGDSKKTMEMEAGTILVKMVHNNWLFNIVTGKRKEASAVLIRAVEPLNYEGKGNGPGILTRELEINKDLNRKNIFNNKKVWIEEFGNKINNKSANKPVKYKNNRAEKNKDGSINFNIDNKIKDFEIGTSFRVGVTKDSKRHFRYFIKGNKFVSRIR